MGDKRKTAAPITDAPAAAAPFEEEHVEDLEAPAAGQEGILGGNCGAATYIEYTSKDTL